LWERARPQSHEKFCPRTTCLPDKAGAKNANENAFRNSRSFAYLAGNPHSAFRKI